MDESCVFIKCRKLQVVSYYLSGQVLNDSDTYYRIEPVAMFEVKDLNIGLGLHQRPNFVFAISGCIFKTARMRRIVQVI